MWFFVFYENMIGKLLGFGRMHKNKKKIKWKFFIFFKFWRKLGIFNIESVSYSVSLQPDIMQNYWKNLQGAHKYFLKKYPLKSLKFSFFLILL